MAKRKQEETVDAVAELLVPAVTDANTMPEPVVVSPADVVAEPVDVAPEPVAVVVEPVVAAPVIPEVVASVVRPCALDSAPVNSKIVVVIVAGKRVPVLMTPDGEKAVTVDDLSYMLPEGARIRKVKENLFVATQLSPAEDHLDLKTVTAREAILEFNFHFHDVGGEK